LVFAFPCFYTVWTEGDENQPRINADQSGKRKSEAKKQSQEQSANPKAINSWRFALCSYALCFF